MEWYDEEEYISDYEGDYCASDNGYYDDYECDDEIYDDNECYDDNDLSEDCSYKEDLKKTENNTQQLITENKIKTSENITIEKKLAKFCETMINNLESIYKPKSGQKVYYNSHQLIERNPTPSKNVEEAKLFGEELNEFHNKNSNKSTSLESSNESSMKRPSRRPIDKNCKKRIKYTNSTPKYTCYLPAQLMETIDLINKDNNNILLFNAPSESIFCVKNNHLYNSYRIEEIIKEINHFRLEVYLKSLLKLPIKRRLSKDSYLKGTSNYERLYRISLKDNERLINFMKDKKLYFKNQVNEILEKLSQFEFKTASEINIAYGGINKKLFHTFYMYYLFKGNSPFINEENEELPYFIKNVLEEDYVNFIKSKKYGEKYVNLGGKKVLFKTGKDFSKIIFDGNLTDENLKSLQYYPIDEIPKKKRDKILNHLPSFKLLQFYQFINIFCGKLSFIKFARIDRAFLNFILLAYLCNQNLYNFSIHPDHPNHDQSEKFLNKVATLIAITVGSGQLSIFEENSQRLLDYVENNRNGNNNKKNNNNNNNSFNNYIKKLFTDSLNQLNELVKYEENSIINPSTDKPWTEEEQIITEDEFKFWLRDYIYPMSQDIPCYNDFTYDKLIKEKDMKAILSGIGLNPEGLEHNKKPAQWKSLKKNKPREEYDQERIETNKTHSLIEITESSKKKLIDTLFFLQGLNSELLFEEFNKRNKNCTLKQDIVLSF